MRKAQRKTVKCWNCINGLRTDPNELTCGDIGNKELFGKKHSRNHSCDLGILRSSYHFRKPNAKTSERKRNV